VRLFRILLIIGILVVSVGPVSHVDANYQPQQDFFFPRYFPETGFWVQGHFREYWETRGGLYIFGYPISGVFFQDGFYRQYFERSVFEFHPQHVGTQYEVQLMLLGSLRTQDRRDEPPFRPIAPFESDRYHMYFKETGHSVSFGFKHFWLNNQGLRNFGFPISQEFDERNQPPPAGDGEIHVTQYFERGRFEWHPEHRGTRYEYLLGLLGREYLQVRGAPAEALQRQDKAMPPFDPIRNIRYGPHVGYGFNVFFRGDANSWEYHNKMFDVVEGAGFNWIKIKAQWSELEREPGFYDPVPLERIIDHANARGMKVIVGVAKTPTWLRSDGGIPSDTKHFRNFMEHMARHFQGKVHGWEIWNEQNLAYEVGGYVDPGEYVQHLKAGYEGVKAGDPHVPVLFGGLTPTGVMNPTIAIDDVEYLRQIYA
jgi:polysaccharide biosynthesis protein PslG